MDVQRHETNDTTHLRAFIAVHIALAEPEVVAMISTVLSEHLESKLAHMTPGEVGDALRAALAAYRGLDAPKVCA